ncbi:MAG: response regulator [Spirochaeta sp.]|nr:response regulator [Spirochaeta sp.]
MSELSGLSPELGSPDEDLRILIVEDERLVAVDIKHRLRRLGYSVIGVVADGVGAVSATKKLSPRLVLMDIGLQGAMDGIEAANEISKLGDIPIIFVTANADDAVLQRALKGNAVGYVLKPFRDREIVVSIQMALYKTDTERELREARWWTDNTLETISEGVVAADESGLVRYMNSSAELLTGWSRDEIIGKHCDNVLHTEAEACRTQIQLFSCGVYSSLRRTVARCQ